MRTRQSLLLFFALAFAFSWLCWAPLVLASQGLIATRPPQALHLLGGLGPALAALVAARFYGGKQAQRSVWRRVVRWRVPAVWYVIVVAGPFVLYFAIVVVARVTAGVPWNPSAFGRSEEFPDLPMWAFWVASIVFYGFGEETGWRGFALPHLQRKANAAVATLILSVFWALWHLPLFWFTPGLSRMGIVEIAGWYFSILAGAVLLTWLMNSTGSVLIAALLHGTMDIVFISPGPAVVTKVLGAAVTVLGVVVFVVTGPRYLSTRGMVIAGETGIHDTPKRAPRPWTV